MVEIDLFSIIDTTELENIISKELNFEDVQLDNSNLYDLLANYKLDIKISISFLNLEIKKKPNP